MRARSSGARIGALLGVLGLLLGCRVESSNKQDSEQLRLAMPMGGLQVKTDAAAAASGVGLPVYPGATLQPKGEGGKGNGSADINLSLGNLRLRVKALSYRSGDAPDAVRTFYAKELGRFGVVIACRNDVAVGEPSRTPEGLTCSSDGHHGVQVDDGSAGAITLKAGSPQHQHLVEIKGGSGGTEFALVALDLPRQLTDPSGSDEQK